MSKRNHPDMEKIYKELDKCTEETIAPTFRVIKEFLTKKLSSLKEQSEEITRTIQQQIDEIK